MVWDRRTALESVLGILALSALDAVAGRSLQAHPTPYMVLALGGVAWITMRCSGGGSSYGFVAGMGAWVVYFAAYGLCATILIGWNQSVSWNPEWYSLLRWTFVAVLVSLIARAKSAQARSAELAETRS